MENAGIIASIVLGGIACILAVFAFVQSVKKISVIEGRHLQEVITLREKISSMNGLVGTVHGIEVKQKEIEANVKWLIRGERRDE